MSQCMPITIVICDECKQKEGKPMSRDEVEAPKPNIQAPTVGEMTEGVIYTVELSVGAPVAFCTTLQQAIDLVTVAFRSETQITVVTAWRGE